MYHTRMQYRTRIKLVITYIITVDGWCCGNCDTKLHMSDMVQETSIVVFARDRHSTSIAHLFL